MSAIHILQKLGHLLVQPAEILGEYAREPLRQKEHERQEASAQRQHEREKDKILAEERARSEMRINEKKHDTDQAIRAQTEVKRALAEIEELSKDRSLARMVKASEAMMRFRTEMTELISGTVSTIGNMKLDLRRQAQDLMVEKTKQYKEMQDIAISDAMKEMEEVEKRFSGNERAKEILYRAIDDKLASITDACKRFMEELNKDIAMVNNSITNLSESSMAFVENHLEQFNKISPISGDIKQIK